MDLKRVPTSDIGPSFETATRVPTSVILEGLVRDAPDGDVTLEWIVGHLGERSFGIVMLLVALVGLLPGIASLVGVLLAIPAIQMILGRGQPVLPGRIARRRISAPKAARLFGRLIPVLRWLERFVRPRWRTPFEATKRVVGVVILLLCATVIAPIPFNHLIPLFVIMLLAFAFLEEDGILLCIALFGAAVSLAITAGAVWGAIEAGLLL